MCLPPLPHRAYTIYTCLPPIRPSSFTYMSCLPPPTLVPSRLLSFSSNTIILSFFFMHVCFPPSSYFICFLQAFLSFLPAGHPIVFFFPPTSSSTVPIVLQTFLLFVLIYTYLLLFLVCGFRLPHIVFVSHRPYFKSFQSTAVMGKSRPSIKTP